MLKRLETFFKRSIQPFPTALWGFFAASVILIAGLYLGTNEWSFYHGSSMPPLTLPLDLQIPFIPAFIFIYALHYVISPATFFLLRDHPRLFRYILGFYLLAFVHYLVFILYPVKNILRPTLPPLEWCSIGVCNFFYHIDRPYNLFPSMHVSLAVYSACFLQRLRHKAAPVFLLLALLIFLAILFTKQHYLVDGISGALLGIVFLQIVF